jgi:hypothetical protein
MGDLNAGKEWSKIDLLDLRHCAGRGDSVGEIATFLMRTEAEVREKMQELGLDLKSP